MKEFPEKHMIGLFRRILGVMLVGVLGILVPGSAAASTSGNRSGTDIAVGLDAIGSVLLAGARYDVSITNNGPETVTSAIVVVQLDSRSGPGGSVPPCPLDTTTDTLTCAFGPLAVGATATLSNWVYFGLPYQTHLTIYATATRTASTPTDPDPSNDAATVPCWYSEAPGSIWPPTQWRLYC
jgi:hypothetical protein